MKEQSIIKYSLEKLGNSLADLLGEKINIAVYTGKHIDTLDKLIEKEKGFAINQILIKGRDDKCAWIFMGKEACIRVVGKLLMMPDKALSEMLEDTATELPQSVTDAQKEIYNVLIGTLSDVFREKLNSEIHLAQGEFFLGNVGEYDSGSSFVLHSAQITFEDGYSFDLHLVLRQGLLEELAEGRETQPEESNDTAERRETVAPETEPIMTTRHDGTKAILKGRYETEEEETINAGNLVRTVPTIDASSTLEEAHKKLTRSGAPLLVVTDGTSLVGILTEADLKDGLSPFLNEPFLEYCREQDLATKRFKVEWFTTETRCIASSTSIFELARVMVESGLPYIPVCLDGSPTVLGAAFFTDVIKALLELTQGEEPKEHERKKNSL